MDRQDAIIATLHEERPQRVPNARRQARRARMDDSDDYHEDEFEDEEDQALLTLRQVYEDQMKLKKRE